MPSLNPSSPPRRFPISPEPIYLRFENTSPPHRKFYEVEIELSLFYPKRLIRRWGRIGTRRPRTIRMVMMNPDELLRKLQTIVRLRKKHGYKAVADVRVPILKTSAA